MIPIINIEKLPDETAFEYKLRLCRAKESREVDLDWQEIVNLLKIEVTPDHFRKTAKGLLEYDNYLHGIDGVATTVLSISDLHIPFQLDISTFSEYAGKVDILQLNGDIVDCAQLSKFSKSYRTSPIEEMILARQYIIELIEMLNPKKVMVNHGNHELRMGAYLARNIDNELQELMPETAFDYIFADGFTHYDRKTKAKTKYEPLCSVFDDIEIEYAGTWFTQIGNTILCHPKTFSSGIMKTAEKAMYWFRNEGYSFSTLVMAHTHRVGEYKIGNTMIYEQGACCKTDKITYLDGQLTNSQKQGFIFLCLDEDGSEIKAKTKLVTLN